MPEFKHSTIDELPTRCVNDHEGYEYIRRAFIHRSEAKQCVVNIFEIPPHKSAFPYHYHHKNEETFYIISGEGILRTPQGERTVKAGDLLFFPANANGAHKLTNSSDTEPLVYLDFDTMNEIDVTTYPDSDKIAIWGTDTNRVFRNADQVNYYDGE